MLFPRDVDDSSLKVELDETSVRVEVSDDGGSDSLTNSNLQFLQELSS